MNAGSTIGGIVPALVRPSHDDESLDLDALPRLLDHVLDAGSHGVFVAGSQGEFWSLTVDEHDRLIRTAVEHVAGRLPVYAGASAVCTRDAIALARQSSAAGADAVTILAPHLIQPSPIVNAAADEAGLRLGLAPAALQLFERQCDAGEKTSTTPRRIDAMRP